jgi:hypothetical protein
MRWLGALLKIDRRIIFAVIGVVLVLPIIFPFGFRTPVTSPTRKLFDAVEAIPPRGKALAISVDYAPQTEPELHPMTVSLLRHAFSRRTRVLVLALWVQGLGLAEDALTRVAEEFNEKARSSADSILYGRDYVFLGWQPPPVIPILGMGTSIRGVFPADYYGNETDTLPMMADIDSYNDMALLVSISGTTAPVWYAAYAQTRFGIRVGAGITAVSVADFFPYLETGQFSGMLAGMKGAAEYEGLVAEELHLGGRRKAMEGMSSQAAAHIAIMIFVVLANIGYFAGRRRRS